MTKFIFIKINRGKLFVNEDKNTFNVSLEDWLGNVIDLLKNCYKHVSHIPQD